MSAVLGGPVAGLVTGAIAFLFRLLLGGNVLVPGIGIALAMALGIVARRLGAPNRIKTLLMLGIGLAVLRGLTPFLAVAFGYRELAEAPTLRSNDPSAGGALLSDAAPLSWAAC